MDISTSSPFPHEDNTEQASDLGQIIEASTTPKIKTALDSNSSSDLTLETLNQTLEEQGKQLEDYFEALKGQNGNQIAHMEALQAHSLSLTQHMDILKNHSTTFEDYSKIFEAHSQALTSLLASFQTIASQLQVLPHLIDLINGLQDEVASGFRFRPGTMDREIFRAINYKRYNEYRLPETFNPTDIIIDIGAHIGSFTYACLRRQAQHIYSYEAFIENMQLLRQNLEPFDQVVELNHKAVWRSDTRITGLTYMPDETARYKGLGVVDIKSKGLPVESIGLDEILARFEQVRLLKIDCDRSEYVVLLTSRLLGRVEAICIEYELIEKAPEFMGLTGYSRLDRTVLEDFLQEQNFNTEHRATANPNIGFIFATRKDVKTKVWQ